MIIDGIHCRLGCTEKDGEDRAPNPNSHTSWSHARRHQRAHERVPTSSLPCSPLFSSSPLHAPLLHLAVSLPLSLYSCIIRFLPPVASLAALSVVIFIPVSGEANFNENHLASNFVLVQISKPAGIHFHIPVSLRGFLPSRSGNPVPVRLQRKLCHDDTVLRLERKEAFFLMLELPVMSISRPSPLQPELTKRQTH